MRSGAGAFCPGSRRLECLLDFLTCALPLAEARGFTALRVGLLGVDGADHTVAAVRSSASPAMIDVRSLISASKKTSCEISNRAPCIPRRARLDNRTIVGFPLVRHRARTR